MIRYTYNSQVQPPAPFVLVTLRNPSTEAEVRNVPAQLDIGADRTVLPLETTRTLALKVVGGVTVVGFGSGPYEAPLFSVELGIHTLPVHRLEVVASPAEPWILLGRDVLNSYRLVLDGPKLALEIEN